MKGAQRCTSNELLPIRVVFTTLCFKMSSETFLFPLRGSLLGNLSWVCEGDRGSRSTTAPRGWRRAINIGDPSEIIGSFSGACREDINGVLIVVALFHSLEAVVDFLYIFRRNKEVSLDILEHSFVETTRIEVN